MKAKDHILDAAKLSPVLQEVFVEGLPEAPQAELMIDREKAAALCGVSTDKRYDFDQSWIGICQ